MDKKIKLPKKLNICGIDYDIEYIYDRPSKHGANSGGSQTSWSTKIWVDTNQSEERVRWTLIHEIVEAISDANDLDLEHYQISSLATGIYGVIKQLLK